MRNTVYDLLQESGFSVVDSMTLEGKDAAYGTIPEGLEAPVKKYLNTNGKRLYQHQTKAMEEALQGKDICLATSTGSGKSLIFMIIAINKILSNAKLSVLCLYPLKALIEDQYLKWKKISDYFGISIGLIHGGVPLEDRYPILKKRIILMTPDVAHAWLLGRTTRDEIKRYLSNINMLVLDEVHVYDGAFGSNMALFMRRLLSISKVEQIIYSSATIDNVATFIEHLSGRKCICIDESINGAKKYRKEVLLIRKNADNAQNELIQALVKWQKRFLYFVNSRKAVESIASHLISSNEFESFNLGKVLPYRDGYENADRRNIQQSLANGSLHGVVSTSALEMGVDIGDLECVVIDGLPLTAQSFIQRLGRAGRSCNGFCIVIADEIASISSYMAKINGNAINYLYLNNKYISFSHVLCFLKEVKDLGMPLDDQNLNIFPEMFRKILQAELDGKEDSDIAMRGIRKRSGQNPQYWNSLRAINNESFDLCVTYSNDNYHEIGNIDWLHVLFEAYPGGTYFHMGIRYKVCSIEFAKRTIVLLHGNYPKTSPISDERIRIFKNRYSKTKKSIYLEVGEFDIEVISRTVGYLICDNGKEHYYTTDSEIAKAPLVADLSTTGVVVKIFASITMSLEKLHMFKALYCREKNIRISDLGISVLPDENGFVLYDTAYGGLGLSSLLFWDINTFSEQFSQVFGIADWEDCVDQILNIEEETIAVTVGSKYRIQKPSGDFEIVTISGQKNTSRGEVFLIEQEDGEVRMIPRKAIISKESK